MSDEVHLGEVPCQGTCVQLIVTGGDEQMTAARNVPEDGTHKELSRRADHVVHHAGSPIRHTTIWLIRCRKTTTFPIVMPGASTRMFKKVEWAGRLLQSAPQPGAAMDRVGSRSVPKCASHINAYEVSRIAGYTGNRGATVALLPGQSATARSCHCVGSE